MPGRDPRAPLGTLMALSLTLGAGAAAAQDFTPLRVGQTVQATLQASDPVLSSRGHFRVYRFEAQAGTRYVLSMESGAFDSFLSVARQVGGITDILKSDDDGGEELNARLRWTPSESGTYLAIAQAFGEDGVGPFTLGLAVLPPPSTAAPRALQVGDSVAGALAETDAVLEEDESFFDSYTVRGRRGQRLVVEMRSDSFDTYLHFGRGQGDAWESLKTDDDGLQQTDSRLRITLPEDGEYVIRANAIGAGDTGPYTLAVRERPAAPQPVAQPLRAGAPVAGELTDADAVTDEEVYYDLFTVQARRGQRLQFDMTAEFDTYLELGRPGDGEWDSIRTDDDSGDGTNARLRYTATEDGALQLRARSFSEGTTGRYTLTLRELPAPAPARARAVRIGETVSGALLETDALLPDEEIHYDLYSLRARQGQRLVVEMRSDSFDTYLDFGRMRDGQWESLRTDDDGLGEGTNSRLRYTVTEDGEYMVRARSLGEGSTGPYTLSVAERAAGTPSAPRAIRAGETLEGALADSDLELEDASFYDVYTYAGRAGEELTISMTSEAFDTFLQFGRMTGESYEEIATNDDGPQGTNSQVVVRLTTDGEYVIRANSLGAGRTGAYRVTVASSRDR